MGCWWSRPGSGLALALAVSLASGPACNGSSDEADDGMVVGMDASVGEDGAAPVACDVVAPTSCPEPAPKFTDVEPIFQERCVSCHAGIPGGPWPLTSYSHVASWAGQIRAAMTSCTMPPADAGIDMPTEEREQILLWIRCGFPP